MISTKSTQKIIDVDEGPLQVWVTLPGIFWSDGFVSKAGPLNCELCSRWRKLWFSRSESKKKLTPPNHRLASMGLPTLSNYQHMTIRPEPGVKTMIFFLLPIIVIIILTSWASPSQKPGLS